MGSDDRTTTGRNARLCAQIGVIVTPPTSGWTIGPPALALYAVDPVGVAMITPSPMMSTPVSSSSIRSDISIMRCGAPAVMTASLIAVPDSRTPLARSTSTASSMRSRSGGFAPKTRPACFSRSDASNSARNPRRPAFTPTIGFPKSSSLRACAMSVPSPPTTTAKSNAHAAASGSSSASITSTDAWRATIGRIASAVRAASGLSWLTMRSARCMRFLDLQVVSSRAPS